MAVAGVYGMSCADGPPAASRTMTSIRRDTRLSDEAVKALGVKGRTEAVQVALREIVALKKFKNLMAKHAGRLTFEALGE